MLVKIEAAPETEPLSGFRERPLTDIPCCRDDSGFSTMNLHKDIHARHEFIPSGFAAFFFGKCRNSKVVIEKDGVQVKLRNISDILSLSDIENVRAYDYILWKRLEICTNTKEKYNIYGLSANNANEIIRVIHLKQFFEDVEHDLIIINDWISKAKDKQYYIAESEYKRKYKEAEYIYDKFSEYGIHCLDINNLALEINTHVNELGEFVKAGRKFKNTNNKRFVQSEIEKFKDLFSTIEDNPLTVEQTKAIVTNEDSTIVVASAGSGKTSMLVGKVAYLLKKQLCSPEDILIIAFNRAAKEEIEQRIQKKVGVHCDTHTFHSFGLEVIAKSKRKKPSLAKFVENDTAYKEIIQKIITDLCQRNDIYGKIVTFFIAYLLPYTPISEYKVPGDYFKAVKKNKETLTGVYVRSLEELEIADFLTLFSIQYEYEPNYKHDTATQQYRQYQPDFYLPEYDIYIEHFALDRDGSSPYGESYIESLAWKRNIHAEYNTTMIETYSYLKSEGTLTAYLYAELEKHKVVLSPIARDEFIKQSEKYITIFAHLCSQFLTLFKNGNASIDAVSTRIQNNDYSDYETKRYTAFLTIFEAIFNDYQHILKKSKTVDFNDMINLAVDTISSGYNNKPYKFILVDEFQDISVGRASLIQALQKAIPDVKLFCVGDDWQSIYRFAGSDISVMTNFQAYFGYFARIDLTKTFRFNNKIAHVASSFIQKNDKQLKKEVISHHKNIHRGVILFIPDENSGKYLEEFAKEIAKETQNTATDVLILGRYNYLENAVAYKDLKQAAPKCNFKFRSVHSAKGLEADYVILLGLSSGRHGFPSEIVDDPILDLVLARSDDYPFAEERRLFYVALTRAKRKVFIVAPQNEISAFFTELAEDFDSSFVDQRNIIIANRSCPSCKSGLLVQRTGKNGFFFGCSNFPECTFTREACPACSIGYFSDSHDGFFTCDKCGNKTEACQMCRNGFLVQKSGQYGLFWGCSNYHHTGCRFTKNIV